MNSKHYTRDRQKREELIRQIGTGIVIKEEIVDKGHRNGAEIHKVTNTGIILIYNQRTKILCTKLIARPGQIRRYYKENEVIPKEVIELARYHQKMGWHEV